MPRCGSARICQPSSIDQSASSTKGNIISTRRQFVASSAVAASALAFPLVEGAQRKTVKIGVLHPVTGALTNSGQQDREGALMAIEDINKTGGVKWVGGATIEALLSDAQSTPKAGTAEIEKMNEAGVLAVVGAFDSASAWQQPRLLANTTCRMSWWPNCMFSTRRRANRRAVMIIHEESLFGTGTANLLARELPGYGYEVKEVIKHANPTRDFNNIVLRMKAANPDIVIPANYYSEYALLFRPQGMYGAKA